MRIAFLCRSLPIHRQGGLEWHAWDLARGLARRGHHLRVVTTPFDPPEPGSRLARELKDPRLEFLTAGPETSGRYSLRYFRESARVVGDWARRGEIDLVHAQGFAALFLSRAALGGVPLVATIHGTLWSETLLDRRSRGGLTGLQQAALLWRFRHRVLLQPAFARMLARADRLVVDSEFTRAELMRLGSSFDAKTRLVPLGVDLDRFPPPGAAKDRTPETSRPVRLLMVGRLEREKGFEVVLRALACCRPGTWSLRIGGEGPDRPRLEQVAQNLARDAGVPSLRMEFFGRVPSDRLAREFAGADLFLNPDLTQPAFGLVALEAMLQATPVLASRVGAMPEVLGSWGGWWVPPGDVGAWRTALDELLSDPARLARQGQQARQAALRRFSLDRMLDRVESAYREVVN